MAEGVVGEPDLYTEDVRFEGRGIMAIFLCWARAWFTASVRISVRGGEIRSEFQWEAVGEIGWQEGFNIDVYRHRCIRMGGNYIISKIE